MDMKKIIYIIMAFAAVLSCTKEPQIQNNVEGQEYTISLMPIGDIVASYSPLTKAELAKKSWYGINIKRDGSDYMFGVYDDINKFKIQLSSSYSYSFEVTAIADTDINFFPRRTYGLSDYYQELLYPFYFGEFKNLYYSGTHIDKYISIYKTSDKGVVDESQYAVFLNCMHNSYLVFNKTSPAVGGYSVSREDYDVVTQLNYISQGINSNEWYRYYGTKDNFTPSSDESIPITMKHEGFGLCYTVSGICDGSVSVVIDNAQLNDTVTYYSQPSLTSDYTSPQKVIEFRDMTSETEQVKVTVVWTRGNKVVDDLGSTTINVRRNKINKINITLGEHSSNKSMSISTDASDFSGNENKEITI